MSDIKTDTIYLQEAAKLKLRKWEKAFVKRCTQRIEEDGIAMSPSQREKLQQIIIRRGAM